MTQIFQNNFSLAQQAKAIARRTLAGDYDVLLACRDLASLNRRLPQVPKKIMNTFVGVSSEIDDLPIGAEREHWAAEALRLKDIEATDYRGRVESVVKEALRELILVLDQDEP